MNTIVRILDLSGAAVQQSHAHSLCRMVYGWMGKKVESVFNFMMRPVGHLAVDGGAPGTLFGSTRAVGYNEWTSERVRVADAPPRMPTWLAEASSSEPSDRGKCAAHL